ncbi:MAG: hypothetical protein Q8R35_02235 [bacterium]|nr:hypothetical protein [bacterium]
MERLTIPASLKPAARMAYRAYRTLRRAIRYPYYAIGTSEPVWFWLMNRQSRERFRRHPGAPDAVEKRIIGELKTSGIAVTHLEELFPGRDLLGVFQRHAVDALAAAKVGRKKGFLRYAWRDSADTILLDLTDPLVRLAIEPNILEVVNAYMGMWTKLDFFSLAVTVPVQDGTDPAGSQRWHRDPGDRRICKLFLYLTNVTDTSAGPFCYVQNSHEGGRWRGVYPPRPDDGYYPPAGDIERAVPPTDIQECFGRAGTLIFCDTTGLHRGGYSTSRERIMFTAAYSAKWSLTHPIKYRYPKRFDTELTTLSPLQHHAIDNR